MVGSSRYFLLIILVIFLGKRLYLCFHKPNLRCKIPRTQHGEFIKVIECRLGFQFLNRENSCQKSQCYESGRLSSFKHSPKKINISILYLLVLRLISYQNIPFINNYNKLISCCIINFG